MSYYPKERCYFCGADTECWQQIYTCSKDCPYSYGVEYIAFDFTVDNESYFVDLSENKTEILKDMLDQDGCYVRQVIYTQDKILEMPVQEWKDLIIRLKNLQIFK